MLGKIVGLFGEALGGDDPAMNNFVRDVRNQIGKTAINYFVPENESGLKQYIIIGATPELESKFCADPKPDNIVCMTKFGTDDPAKVNCKEINVIYAGRPKPLPVYWVSIPKVGMPNHFAPAPPVNQ